MYHSAPRGQGLVEYALIILLVGIAVIVLVAVFGTAVGNMYSTVITNF
jgi:Flp pilus assembly pilin Flp